MKPSFWHCLFGLGMILLGAYGCTQPSAPTSNPATGAKRSLEADPDQSKISSPTDGLSGDLIRERAGFKTQVRPNPNYQADGPVDQPPAKYFNLVYYPSNVGDLAAYLSPDPKDGKKHPALVYAHGGFGGINGLQFGKEQFAPFRDDGYVIFCPSWRGENVNKGMYEMFYGEVDDALAAIEYVKKLPYVDPARIYMLGHSTGGTVTLLSAEANAPLRAAFPFGGAPDLAHADYGNTPFDRRIEKEVRLRSPIHFIKSLKVPTFYFEGNFDPDGSPNDGYLTDARQMLSLAEAAKAPLKVYTVQGGTHFNIVGPISKLLVNKLKADTGDQCNLSITVEEVNQAFKPAARRK